MPQASSRLATTGALRTADQDAARWNPRIFRTFRLKPVSLEAGGGRWRAAKANGRSPPRFPLRTDFLGRDSGCLRLGALGLRMVEQPVSQRPGLAVRQEKAQQAIAGMPKGERNAGNAGDFRSEEHKSELPSTM